LQVDRRGFLLMRTASAAELSCERLFMRFVDARMDGTTAELFAHLEADLRGVTALRLIDRSWLTDADLRSRVEPMLRAFTAAGGRVE
jgi:hypothetical protein